MFHSFLKKKKKQKTFFGIYWVGNFLTWFSNSLLWPLQPTTSFWVHFPFFFFFLKLIFKERKEGGERHQFVVLLVYAFIGCFLYVSSPGAWTCNLGISGWCPYQLDYAARAFIFLLTVTNPWVVFSLRIYQR